MRREDFDLDVSAVEADAERAERPTLTVSFAGSVESLRERLLDRGSEPLEAGEIDLAFRLQDSLDAPDAGGVLAITNRITGEYVLEVDAEAEDVLSFVRATREFEDRNGDAEFRLRIVTEDGEFVSYEKRTLLVYGEEGELLRGHSLIPSGVEI